MSAIQDNFEVHATCHIPITTHHTNYSNRSLILEADTPNPKYGNASHKYHITVLSGPPMQEGEDSKPGVVRTHMLEFQCGPIGEVGVNGITNEVLVAIAKHRLDGFQSSEFACAENAEMLECLNKFLEISDRRTRAREARGVEGTNQV